MFSYIIRRLLIIIPTVFVAISFLFFIFYVLPGDPATLIAGGADRNPNPVQIEQINDKYGLDDPVIVQFANYWKNVLQGDLGESFQQGKSVNEIVADKAPNSMRLAFWAFGIEVALRPFGRALLGDPKIFVHRQDDHGGHRHAVCGPRVRARLHAAVHVRGLPEQAQLAGVDATTDVGHRRATNRGIVVPLLHPDRARPVAIPRPAGDHAGVCVDRARRSHDARLDARDARLRLHAHGQGEGAR